MIEAGTKTSMRQKILFGVVVIFLLGVAVALVVTVPPTVFIAPVIAVFAALEVSKAHRLKIRKEAVDGQISYLTTILAAVKPDHPEMPVTREEYIATNLRTIAFCRQETVKGILAYHDHLYRRDGKRRVPLDPHDEDIKQLAKLIKLLRKDAGQFCWMLSDEDLLGLFISGGEIPLSTTVSKARENESAGMPTQAKPI